MQRALLAAACLWLPLAAAAQREPLVQKELRERFGDWADAYVATLPSYAAHEFVRQTRFDRRGNPSSERSAAYAYSLQRSEENPREFVESRSRVTGETNGNSGKPPDESSIGLFSKAVLLVTRFAPRYQDRMKYFFVPDHSESVSDYVVVGYRQTGGAGLMEVDGKEVFPIGRAWVDPDRGRIIRIEEEFGQAGKNRYSVTVDFADDAVTRGWLPIRVIIRFFDKDRIELQNEYIYSAFRPL